jgi:ADP-heptose:LPS heptosyltransferase
LWDFADSAAIMRQLDLVISIDTGPAHLSASLGRPTWLLLSANCDWRWLEHSHHTPWYPSMLLFRQSELGDWSRPLSEVMIRLQKEMGPRSRPLGPA